jgi:hypothetical protein
MISRYLLEDAEAAYGDLVYFCEVRWLSRGNMLARVFELKNEINQFLMEKKLPNAALFADSKWLCKLAFLTDITGHLNQLNITLQGKDITVPEMVDKVQAFRSKLVLFEGQLKKSNFVHFKHLKECNKKDIDVKECAKVIANIRDEFDSRFKDFDKCSVEFALFTNPFVVDVDTLPDELQLEVIDLQNNSLLKARSATMNPLEFLRTQVAPSSQFPMYTKSMQRIAAMFGSTYRCEQLFSSMKNTKSKLRTRLTDSHLNDILLLTSSSLQPDIASLSSQKRQHQRSH